MSGLPTRSASSDRLGRISETAVCKSPRLQAKRCKRCQESFQEAEIFIGHGLSTTVSHSEAFSRSPDPHTRDTRVLQRARTRVKDEESELAPDAPVGRRRSPCRVRFARSAVTSSAVPGPEGAVPPPKSHPRGRDELRGPVAEPPQFSPRRPLGPVGRRARTRDESP